MLATGQHSPSGLDKPRKGRTGTSREPLRNLTAGTGAKGLTQQEIPRPQGAHGNGSKPGRKSKQLQRGPKSTGSGCSEVRKAGLNPRKYRKPATHLLVSQQPPVICSFIHYCPRELSMAVSAWDSKPTRKGHPCRLQQKAVGSDRLSSVLPFTSSKRSG